MAKILAFGFTVIIALSVVCGSFPSVSRQDINTLISRCMNQQITCTTRAIHFRNVSARRKVTDKCGEQYQICMARAAAFMKRNRIRKIKNKR